MKKAIVIFSGGQDSTTCLGWAKNRFDEVAAISFIYGQKHSIEIDQAQKIAAQLDVPLKVVDISFYENMVNSALVGNSQVNMNDRHEDNDDLPASFVPNRNALFILLTHSYAQKIKADTIITGVCETDFSGYPDCRRAFIDAMENALYLGSEKNIKIETPLMALNKAETFKLAEDEGILELVVKESYTCYNGDSTPNEWGMGCGDCPACKLRKKGFEEFKAMTAK
jgi:7-cyano-7-deazaguanine synthase